MKIAPRTFRIGWDVHAWAGVVSALVLYVMFFAGALTLFQDEIAAWQEPDVVETRGALGPAFERVVREQGLEGKPRVALRLHAHGPLDVEWKDDAGEHALRVVAHADATTREPRSRIARFLFELHFLGVARSGIYVAGLFAIALGITLVTGLVIQWKDLLRQLVRIRPRAPLRVWTSDVHKVLGVFGIPFQLFFAWSGAVLCLAFVTVWPALAKTAFHGDVQAARAAYGDLPMPPRPTGERAALPDLDALVAQAEARIPGLRTEWIGVQHVGDARSSVRVYGEVDGVPFGRGQVLLAARDGAELGVSDPRASPPVGRFTRWFFGLHFARFGVPLRLLYALFALATCAVIATGNVVWIERRDPRRLHLGNRLLERATIGTCAGLPLALSALFAANRLLPAGLAHRASIELIVFWSAWAMAFGVAFASAARRVASVQTLVAGALFALAALADLVAGHRAADPHVRTVTIVLGVLAVIAIASARAIARRRAPLQSKAQPVVP